jgi:hypothetical protein
VIDVRVSNEFNVFPPVSESDSLKTIFPGMLMSNRWTFRCKATSVPSGL